MWVEFGTGRSHRYIPVHMLAQSVGSQKYHTLPLCHALTVCDTTSAFYGIGKRTAWAACSWDAQLTDTLSEPTVHPDGRNIDSKHMEVLEKNHGLDVYKDIENFPCECRSSEALFYKETKLLSRFYLLSKHSFSMLTGLFTKRPTYGSSGSNHNRNYLILQHRDGT